MSTWTYLYRPDNKKVFCVIDIHDWRETSRVTQGFSENKVQKFCERRLTAEEEKDFAHFMRMYSCSYDDFQVLYEDEKRIAGKEFAEKLREKFKLLRP